MALVVTLFLTTDFTSLQPHLSSSHPFHRCNPQLRLARDGSMVYVHVFLEPSVVPVANGDDGGSAKVPDDDLHRVHHGPQGGRGSTSRATRVNAEQPVPTSPVCWKLPLPLPLPFVVDGGLDSTWPRGSIRGVTLLGEDVTFGFVSRSTGLDVTGLPKDCLKQSPHVATLAISYTQ